MGLEERERGGEGDHDVEVVLRENRGALVDRLSGSVEDAPKHVLRHLSSPRLSTRPRRGTEQARELRRESEKRTKGGGGGAYGNLEDLAGELDGGVLVVNARRALEHLSAITIPSSSHHPSHPSRSRTPSRSRSSETKEKKPVGRLRRKERGRKEDGRRSACNASGAAAWGQRARTCTTAFWPEISRTCPRFISPLPRRRVTISANLGSCTAPTVSDCTPTRGADALNRLLYPLLCVGAERTRNTA
eukprot:1321992-Rhodomonas_salina.3